MNGRFEYRRDGIDDRVDWDVCPIADDVSIPVAPISKALNAHGLVRAARVALVGHFDCGAGWVAFYRCAGEIKPRGWFFGVYLNVNQYQAVQFDPFAALANSVDDDWKESLTPIVNVVNDPPPAIAIFGDQNPGEGSDYLYSAYGHFLSRPVVRRKELYASYFQDHFGTKYLTPFSHDAPKTFVSHSALIGEAAATQREATLTKIANLEHAIEVVENNVRQRVDSDEFGELHDSVRLLEKQHRELPKWPSSAKQQVEGRLEALEVGAESAKQWIEKQKVESTRPGSATSGSLRIAFLTLLGLGVVTYFYLTSRLENVGEGVAIKTVAEMTQANGALTEAVEALSAANGVLVKLKGPEIERIREAKISLATATQSLIAAMAPLEHAKTNFTKLLNQGKDEVRKARALNYNANDEKEQVNALLGKMTARLGEVKVAEANMNKQLVRAGKVKVGIDNLLKEKSETQTTVDQSIAENKSYVSAVSSLREKIKSLQSFNLSKLEPAIEELSQVATELDLTLKSLADGKDAINELVRQGGISAGMATTLVDEVAGEVKQASATLAEIADKLKMVSDTHRLVSERVKASEEVVGKNLQLLVKQHERVSKQIQKIQLEALPSASAFEGRSSPRVPYIFDADELTETFRVIVQKSSSSEKQAVFNRVFPTESRIRLAGEVLFKKGMEYADNALVKVLIQSGSHYLVVGFSDVDGKESTNILQSQRRAEKVGNDLLARQPDATFHSIGLGVTEENPTKRKNRRVKIWELMGVQTK